MRNSPRESHFYDVRNSKANFTIEVERLLQSHQEDAAAALCRLSVSQQAFERTTANFRNRLSQLPVPAPEEAGLTVGLPPMDAEECFSLEMSRKMQQLFWMLLAAFSICAFAMGYGLGRLS
ncbi:MAG: hypothetical protein HY821_14490 [Acidobacteria bacterium]|nr:hypothetical protein [Acidobacteriota bacterium]